MPKYSFHTKSSKESFSIINADNREQAISLFAKIKALDPNTFLNLYEVSQVKN